MSFAMRVIVGLVGSCIYWTMASIALFLILLPCGMGPDADCEMASPLTFWLAVAAFVLIYVGLMMRLRNWK